MKTLFKGAACAGLIAFGSAIAPAYGQTANTDLTGLYGNLVVFGDSLSDNGNIFAGSGGTVPASPPYFEGRFSDGPTWVELLGFSLARGAINPTALDVNYAFGGARSDAEAFPPGVQVQLEGLFQPATLVNGGLTPDDLVIIWAGGNDFLQTASAIAADDGTLFPTFEAIAAFVAEQATLFSNNYALDLTVLGAEKGADLGNGFTGKGAKTVLVGILPDLAGSPGNTTPEAIALAQLATPLFRNAAFDAIAAAQQATGDDVNFVTFDSGAVLALVLENPAAYGFDNVTDRGIDNIGDGLTYLNWDDVHPSATNHEWLATAAFGLLSARQTLETPLIMSETGLIVSRTLVNGINNRLIANRARIQGGDAGAANSGAGSSAEHGNFGIFADANYNFGDRDGAALVSGFDYDLFSGTVGADLRLGDEIIAGLAFSYADGDVDFDTGGGFDVTAWQVSGFVNWTGERFFADLTVGYGQTDYDDYVRPTVLPTAIATGDTDGDHWSVAANFGYVTEVDIVQVALTGGLRYTSVDVDPFTEAGASILGLDISEQSVDDLVGLIGMDLSTTLGSGNIKFVPHIGVHYEFAIDGSREAAGQLIGNSALPMLVDDDFLENDQVRVTTGLTIVGQGFDLLLNYQIRNGMDRDGQDHQFAARFRLPL